MTKYEALDILRLHQAWKDDSSIFFDPRWLTQAIACMLTYHSADASNKVDKTISQKYKAYQDWLNEIPEITDEEIGEHAEIIETGIHRMYFKAGAKWYRNQLKRK